MVHRVGLLLQTHLTWSNNFYVSTVNDYPAVSAGPLKRRSVLLPTWNSLHDATEKKLVDHVNESDGSIADSACTTTEQLSQVQVCVAVTHLD